jgi:phosphoribosylanthranilate isomerase
MIKICGITRIEDARRAAECGANALGFIFWPRSPRFIDPFRARAIVASLPPLVTPVGVFVNQPAEYVNGVASLVGLGAVQLHGDEDAAYAESIRRPVIKALAFGKHAVDVEPWPSRFMLLLDAHDPEQRGGTGRTIDWSRAAGIARSRPTVLSGGLTPENVAQAIATVKPFGIDVSSGVEDAPGIKSHDRLSALFRALTKQSVVPNQRRERFSERQRVRGGRPRAQSRK